MNLRPIGIAASWVVLLVIGVTGCAGEAETKAPAKPKTFAEQSAEKIQQQVVADMKELKSLRLAGDIDNAGQVLGLDLALNTDGACAGSIAMSGATGKLIAGPQGQFLKGGKAFWTAAVGDKEAAAQITKALGDKWAKMPDEGAGFASFCDLDELLSEFDAVDAENSTIEVGDVVDLAGSSVVPLVSKDGEGQETTAWVSLEAPHYIMQLKSGAAESSGTVTLSDFDIAVDAQAPAKKDYVDLAKI